MKALILTKLNGKTSLQQDPHPENSLAWATREVRVAGRATLQNLPPALLPCSEGSQSSSNSSRVGGWLGNSPIGQARARLNKLDKGKLCA